MRRVGVSSLVSSIAVAAAAPAVWSDGQSVKDVLGARCQTKRVINSHHVASVRTREKEKEKRDIFGREMTDASAAIQSLFLS